jgi:Mrp family chromosome partitioning ATPase
VVSPLFYDCFNYTLLSGNGQDVNVAVGVSSANPGEGKTLVACNLGVSLTVAYQRKTILVDMNVRDPRLHEIFDVEIGPGLLEAVGDGAIHVARTAVRDLFVLTAGVANGRLAGGLRHAMDETENAIEPSLQLEQVAAFRDVLYSLKEHFSFVIVDMPAVRAHLVPLLFTNQLDGVLFVVHAGQTRQGEIEQAVQLINERRVLGFVYNGAERPAPRKRRKP